MEPLRSERIKSIFLRAAELAGAEREAALANECVGEPELRARVEQLLAQSDQTGTMEILPRANPGLQAQAAAPTLGIGHLVSGRFRVLRFIGKGGMGEVYQASDEELGGQLALKIILPGLIQNEEILARFRREVHLARQVTHPNVCRIFDVGRDRIMGLDLLYLTMELIDGETLTEYLRNTGKLTPAEALPLLEQMAAGLTALHEKNIVHRDLKPSNVMMVRTSGGAMRVVIGDFGLARAVLEESLDDGLSRSGVVLGTPGYMAPEQITGQRVSPATDLYSFGVVTYEMVTGKRAFPARHVATQPIAPRAVAPELPPDWENVILRCLEREPGMRPASAAAVMDALTGHSKLARAKPRPAAQSSRRAWWLGGAAAVLLAGLAPWAWQASRKGALPSVGASVNATYLQAVDLLDHGYRPGAAEKAIVLLEPVASAPDAPALVTAALARGYFRRFRETREGAWLEKARVAAERAVAADGKLAPARVVLGRVYTQNGKSDLATQELQAALHLDARNADTYVALAELYEKQGRTADIEPNLQKAIDLAPEYWGGYASLGLHYRNTNRLEDARRQFERLVELAADNPSAYEYLGAVYVQQDRFADARGAFEKALGLAPSSRVYSNLGHVLKLEGNFDKATEMFQRANQLNPRNFISWANLGSAYLWSTNDKAKARPAYEEAIRLAEEVRKVTPNDAQLLAQLAGCYANVGDAKKTIPLIRQSIALDGESAEIAYRVGDAYEMIQRRDEALHWIGIALKRGYSPEHLKRSPELALLRKDPRFTWATK